MFLAGQGVDNKDVAVDPILRGFDFCLLRERRENVRLTLQGHLVEGVAEGKLVGGGERKMISHALQEVARDLEGNRGRVPAKKKQKCKFNKTKKIAECPFHALRVGEAGVGLTSDLEPEPNSTLTLPLG